MSNCNCKTKTEDHKEVTSNIKTDRKDSFIKYFFKSIGFILSVILLPLFNIMIIKILFEIIVLNKDVDIKKVLEYILKNKKSHEIEDDDDDDEDYLTLGEDEVEMLNVEEIR